MKLAKYATLLIAGLLATPAFAEEQGTGIYADSCGYPDRTYDISIYDDGLAEVIVNNNALFSNVDTSYSFFGDSTPSDFLVAIMFNPGDSPLPDYKGQTGWIEIWYGENSLYALENGRGSKELSFCGHDMSDANTGGQSNREPSRWVVSHVSDRADALYVYAGPSAREEIIGSLFIGDYVANFGGCVDSGRHTWCEVKLEGEGSFTGWVDDRYLREQ